MVEHITISDMTTGIDHIHLQFSSFIAHTPVIHSSDGSKLNVQLVFTSLIRLCSANIVCFMTVAFVVTTPFIRQLDGPFYTYHGEIYSAMSQIQAIYVTKVCRVDSGNFAVPCSYSYATSGMPYAL